MDNNTERARRKGEQYNKGGWEPRTRDGTQHDDGKQDNPTPLTHGTFYHNNGHEEARDRMGHKKSKGWKQGENNPRDKSAAP